MVGGVVLLGEGPNGQFLDSRRKFGAKKKFAFGCSDNLGYDTFPFQGERQKNREDCLNILYNLKKNLTCKIPKAFRLQSLLPEIRHSFFHFVGFSQALPLVPLHLCPRA